MLTFKPLQLEDLPRLRDYFGYSGSRICDTTPGTVAMWRDMYKTAWAVEGGSLYFQVKPPKGGETFTLPLGGGRREQLRNLATYCQERSIPLSLYPVAKEEVDRVLCYFPGAKTSSDRDTFDYLYRAEDLQYFRGKKLSGQRNHVNKFVKTYGTWSFQVMTEEDLPALRDFLHQYAQSREKAAASFHEELAKNLEVLNNISTYDMVGGILRVEGEIVGFSLGEVVGNTLFTHIEKANREYLGCYQMLVAQFAQQFAGGEVAFINREDDAGDLGLRKSKLDYRPIALLEKYTILIENPADNLFDDQCGCGCH